MDYTLFILKIIVHSNFSSYILSVCFSFPLGFRLAQSAFHPQVGFNGHDIYWRPRDSPLLFLLWLLHILGHCH